jgi:hypothetical protein
MDGIINVTIVRYGALEKVKINTISIVQTIYTPYKRSCSDHVLQLLEKNFQRKIAEIS